MPNKAIGFCHKLGQIVLIRGKSRNLQPSLHHNQCKTAPVLAWSPIKKNRSRFPQSSFGIGKESSESALRGSLTITKPCNNLIWKLRKKNVIKIIFCHIQKFCVKKWKNGFGKQKKTPFAGKNPKLWLTALGKYDKLPYCQRINLKGLSPGFARFAPVAQLDRATAF